MNWILGFIVGSGLTFFWRDYVHTKQNASLLRLCKSLDTQLDKYRGIVIMRSEAINDKSNL